MLFLKTQQFRVHSIAVRFSRATAFPHEIVKAVEPAFAQLFQPQEEYRATGVVLFKLEADAMIQLDLFGESFRAQKFTRVYQAVDHMQEKFGKHTVFLGTSLLAQQFAQHLGARGDTPQRHAAALQGRDETETARAAHVYGRSAVKSPIPTKLAGRMTQSKGEYDSQHRRCGRPSFILAP